MSSYYYLHTDDNYYWTPEGWAEFKGLRERVKELEAEQNGHLRLIEGLSENINDAAKMLQIAREALEQIRNERKSFGACPAYARAALEKLDGEQ